MRTLFVCMLVLASSGFLHSQGVQARASVSVQIMQPIEVIKTTDSTLQVRLPDPIRFQTYSFIDSIKTKATDSTFIWRRYWATTIIFE
jgi:hypothetical protein